MEPQIAVQIALGGGLVAVTGPPGASKTAALLSGLARSARKRRRLDAVIVVALSGVRDIRGFEAAVAEKCGFPAESLPGALAQRVAEVGALHLVVDDVGAAATGVEAVDIASAAVSWWGAARSPKLTIWLVGQDVPTCRLSRRVVVVSPTPCHRQLAARLRGDSVSARAVARTQAARKPVCDSSLCLDDRRVLARASCGALAASVADLHALRQPPHTQVTSAKLWGHEVQEGSATLNRNELPLAAQLLMVAVYVCSVCHPRRDSALFGKQAAPRGALAAGPFPVTLPRLRQLYTGLRALAADHAVIAHSLLHEAELPHACIAQHHLSSFEAWGLVARASNAATFSSKVSLSEAQHVAERLGIDLVQLTG